MEMFVHISFGTSFLNHDDYDPCRRYILHEQFIIYKYVHNNSATKCQQRSIFSSAKVNV